LLDTKVPALIFIAIAASLLPVTTCYGPQAAMIAESFTPRLRYSGTSLGYQLASIIAGGPSPFIATALFATFASSFPIAVYILGCGVLGIIAAAMLTDYTNKDISAEYDQISAARPRSSDRWIASGRFQYGDHNRNSRRPAFQDRAQPGP
jgi:hypothetical protein